MKLRTLAELIVASEYGGSPGSEGAQIAIEREMRRIRERGLVDEGEMLERLVTVAIETDHTGEPI